MTSPHLRLFGPTVTSHPHVAFEELRDSEAHPDARALMEATFVRMGDPDGNFLDDFQGPGFHSRVFELACFLYLEEFATSVRRLNGSTDFHIHHGGMTIAVEAVTSNPVGGRSEDISLRRLRKLSLIEAQARADEELPIRIGSALLTKLQKRYWERPSCQGLPIVLAIGPFHEAGSTIHIDESVARYLYGIERLGDDWEFQNGLFVRQMHVSSHKVGQKTIPSSFFDSNPDAKHISAVVWANQFTLSKFFRLAAQQLGLPSVVARAIVEGFAVNPDDQVAEFEYDLGQPDSPLENMASGVTVFLNPRAVVPLPRTALACTSLFELRDGRLVRDVFGFHTLQCMTMIQAKSSESP